jgi:hypothetical protein
MADQVLRTGKIAGYHSLFDPEGGPDGDGCEDGFLFVEQRSDGKWYDAEHDTLIEAKEIKCVDENFTKRLNAAVEAMYEAGELKSGEPPPHPETLINKVIPFDEPIRIEVIIEDEDFCIFTPNPGECERVGLPIKRLRH